MSGLSIRKGKVFERLIARMLRSRYPELRRGRQERQGTDAPDLDGSPYWIECKHGKSVSIAGAIEQALKARDGRPILVVTRQDGGPILVTMLMDDWIGRVCDPEAEG